MTKDDMIKRIDDMMSELSSIRDAVASYIESTEVVLPFEDSITVSDDYNPSAIVSEVIEQYLSDSSAISKYSVPEPLHAAGLVPWSYLQRRLYCRKPFKDDRELLVATVQAMVDGDVLSIVRVKGYRMQCYKLTRSEEPGEPKLSSRGRPSITKRKTVRGPKKAPQGGKSQEGVAVPHPQNISQFQKQTQISPKDKPVKHQTKSQTKSQESDIILNKHLPFSDKMLSYYKEHNKDENVRNRLPTNPSMDDIESKDLNRTLLCGKSYYIKSDVEPPTPHIVGRTFKVINHNDGIFEIGRIG